MKCSVAALPAIRSATNQKTTRVGKGIEPSGGQLQRRIYKVILVRLYEVVIGSPFEVVF